MWNIRIITASVLAFFVHVQSVAPPAGKCDTANINPISLPTDEMEKHVNWKVAYATNYDPKSDHEKFIVSVLGGHNYQMLDRKFQKDKSRSDYRFSMTYIDNVFTETYVDVRGNRHNFYMYPLNITSSLAMLIYRCSDLGDRNVYYRFITSPEDVTVPDSDYQEVIAFDQSIFGPNRGTWTKLPEQIKD